MGVFSQASVPFRQDSLDLLGPTSVVVLRCNPPYLLGDEYGSRTCPISLPLMHPHGSSTRKLDISSFHGDDPIIDRSVSGVEQTFLVRPRVNILEQVISPGERHHSEVKFLNGRQRACITTVLSDLKKENAVIENWKI